MDLDDLSKEMASLFHKFVKNGKIEQWHKLTEEAINSKNGAENTALHQVSKEEICPWPSILLGMEPKLM